VILTERVSAAHLAGLRRDRVPYIFAGKQELDLGLALEILNRELGLERLLLEGGGGSTRSTLRSASPSMDPRARGASLTRATRMLALRRRSAR